MDNDPLNERQADKKSGKNQSSVGTSAANLIKNSDHRSRQGSEYSKNKSP